MTDIQLEKLFEHNNWANMQIIQACARVVTSYAGALPEVAGDAAIQVDPTSVEGMTEAMRSLLLDADRCAALKRRGLERARQFSWERSAQAVWDVLEANA